MELITIEQAAVYTGFSIKTLRNWVSKKIIPYYKIDGVRFKKEELVAFVESRRIEPQTNLSEQADAILYRNEKERRLKSVHK